MTLSPTAKKALIATAITALVASLAVNGYLLIASNTKSGPQKQATTTWDNTVTPVWPTTSTEVNTQVSSTPALALDVTWQTPITLATSTVLTLGIYTSEDLGSGCTGPVQSVGTINNKGEYKDWNLVISRYCAMGGWDYAYSLVSPKLDKAVATIEQNDYVTGSNEERLSISLPSVEATLPNGAVVSSTLYSWDISNFELSAVSIIKSFSTKEGNPVYISRRGSYTIEFPGKRYVYYSDDVMTKPYDQVNENDPYDLASVSPHNTFFHIGGLSTENAGCGGAPSLVYVDNKSFPKDTEPFLIFTSKDLVQVPSTAVRGSIYRVTNTNHPAYKQAYELWYSPNWPNGTKPSFETFMKEVALPFFLYKDTLGTWTSYLGADIGMAAECGKPVIYLYPTQTTPVHVQLPSTIDVTVSEPTYPKRGWDTVAEPSGKLTMPDGATFTSLFWEGYGATYKTPTTGYIVKGSEVESFLNKTLTQYGLNNQEAKEFMDFWVPLMKPYKTMRVSFITDEWNKNVPLNVSPKPDTNIRLFMDWSPVSADATIAAPTVTTLERKGFTLVEWGGLLRK